MRPAPLALAVITTLVTFSMGAWPGPGAKHGPVAARAPNLSGAALRFGKSVGSPTQGHLLGGTHLDETAYLRVVPVYGHSDVRWGIEPLVTLIDRAARAVRQRFPDAITSVGHLSRQGGGDVDRHRSHESGRDADVGFFLKNHAGKPFLETHFVAIRGDGNAQHTPGVVFDDARNWAFVQALLTDPHARVTHVFVAAPLRARLLHTAEAMGASAAVRLKAAEVLTQPHGSLPHDDHFHVRIGCPPHMHECIENPTVGRSVRSVVASHGRPRGGVARQEHAQHPHSPAHDDPAASMTVPADDAEGSGEDHDGMPGRVEDPDGL